MPELRLGDTVKCLARQPMFGPDGGVTSAAYGKLSRCTVYGYKKAMTTATAAYVRITYEGDGCTTAAPCVVSMSANHHLLDPVTGKARQAGALQAGDTVLQATPSGVMAPARVISVATAQDTGAYVPLLTNGGLPIVDGVVAYPTSGEAHDGDLEAKHWGQHYLNAPVWQHQALRAADKTPGRSLFELGAQQPTSAFTRKWYAVGAVAAREGRTVCDWAGVAKEMHAAIAQGKQYTEAEALDVYARHLLVVAAGVAEAR